MSSFSISPGKFKLFLLMAVFCGLPAGRAFADSITTQVLNIENVAGVGSVTTCSSPAACGTSQAAGSLSTGTAGALAQISSAEPNFASGVNLWEAEASSELSYNNIVQVPSGAGTITLSGGNVIFTLTVTGTETTSGSGGNAAAEIVIGPNESFVGAGGSSLILPTGTSTVQISTPVTAGSSAFSFTLIDIATCPGYTTVQLALGASCTATADFLDPATISGAAVYGADGSLISDASIVSQSGFSPPVPAPEPASVLLLGTGLLGMLGLIRRRRRV